MLMKTWTGWDVKWEGLVTKKSSMNTQIPLREKQKDDYMS